MAISRLERSEMRPIDCSRAALLWSRHEIRVGVRMRGHVCVLDVTLGNVDLATRVEKERGYMLGYMPPEACTDKVLKRWELALLNFELDRIRHVRVLHINVTVSVSP